MKELYWMTAMIVALAGVSAVPSAVASDCSVPSIVGETGVAVEAFRQTPDSQKPGGVATLLNAIQDSIQAHGLCAGEPSQCVLDFEQDVYNEFRQEDGAIPPMTLPTDFGTDAWANRLAGYATDLAGCLQ